ncbi:uncharacterized protein LY79DRAFT_538226, partial [Colletotrichum navitas]
MAISAHHNAIQALLRASGCLARLRAVFEVQTPPRLLILDSVGHRDALSPSVLPSFNLSVRPSVCLPLCFPASLGTHLPLSQSPVMFPGTSSLHSPRHTSLDCIVTLLRLARSGSLASTSSPQPRPHRINREGLFKSRRGAMAINQSSKHSCPKEGDTPVLSYAHLHSAVNRPSPARPSWPPSQCRPVQQSPAPLA